MTDARFTPIATSERITTLDVIRGVALFGIFLMNVEFFNRPISELDVGLPPGVTGLDYWAGWFVHVFIRSKFWTMFSLLFGMGFAVMLARAQAAGRPFLAPYVRRTLGLALFGFLHCVFIWNGDILFDYAMAAAFLLVVFHAKPKVLLWIAVRRARSSRRLRRRAFPGLRTEDLGRRSGRRRCRARARHPWRGRSASGRPTDCATRAWCCSCCLASALLIGGLATPQTTQAERDRAALDRCQDAGRKGRS